METTTRRISPYTLESVTPTSRPLLEEAVALAGGRVLNLHAGMAVSPAALAAYLGVRKALSQYATLDHKTTAAIMLAVNDVDRSEDSQAVTTMVALRAGWSEAETVELRAGAAREPQLATLLAVVRQAAANSGHVTQPTWQSALAAGWSDAQLVEAFGFIAQTQYVDYFSHYANLQLDLPPALAIEAR